MTQDTLQVLPTQQARQLFDFAERARASLSRYADSEVEYNAVGLQLLDEWIDRHLQQFPKPSKEILTVWGTFLGETFRKRFHGEWGINRSGGKTRLGILCARDAPDLFFVDVMDQMQRRIRSGMKESLAFYYTVKSIEIHTE